MKRRAFLTATCTAGLASMATAMAPAHAAESAEGGKQYFELRRYLVDNEAQQEKVTRFFGEVGIFGAIGFVWLLIHLAINLVSSYRLMAKLSPDFSFFVYVGSAGSLFGYISFMVTHSGLFQNEIWIAMAFLFISIRLGKEKLACAGISQVNRDTQNLV